MLGIDGMFVGFWLCPVVVSCFCCCCTEMSMIFRYRYCWYVYLCAFAWMRVVMGSGNRVCHGSGAAGVFTL